MASPLAPGSNARFTDEYKIMDKRIAWKPGVSFSALVTAINKN
jgi:hypothetical protein